MLFIHIAKILGTDANISELVFRELKRAVVSLQRWRSRLSSPVEKVLWSLPPHAGIELEPFLAFTAGVHTP